MKEIDLCLFSYLIELNIQFVCVWNMQTLWKSCSM